MHASHHPRTSGAPVAAVLTTTATVASVLLGAARPAAADVQPAPVACAVQRAEASAATGRADWTVTCAAERNVWAGVDYYADAPRSQEDARWLGAGETWAAGLGLPATPPLRQVCLTVVESGRWVIGHVCDTPGSR
jgi:hypothetical protein